MTSQALDEIKIGGMGASRRRVEDNRFIRGRGNYVDDIVLPGMLHMEILRSPVAHARIRSIDASKAWDIPGVRLVLTGEMMATRNLAWMPTLSYDTQAVLATDKVRFQGQEVAAVIADDPYIAKDACEAIVVDYEPLPVIVNPTQSLAEGAPLIRDDKENQHDNVIYDWEVGDRAGTDRAFEQADLVSSLELHYPRSHPSPLECCGAIADFNRSTDKLTVYMTTQAPHIIRAAVALVAELPEHMIRIVSPDLGGGFGNKVPVYPGYVVAILASILTERPVKWIEDRTGNLISTGFARDVYLKGELALRKDGKILGVRMHTDADHGAFFSDAQPSKFKIGLMHSAFACYDVPAAHLTARGVYTNKAPGGVAYRCSFRVTEAMYFQERMVQAAADDLGMDQAEFRRVNLVKDDDFPHRTPFGFLTDSGQYAKCLDVGLQAIGYDDFKRQQEEAKARGRLLGIGISTMTEPLGAGNSREYDILGIKMFDSAELRVHMTGKAILRTGAKSQGQGHETTWAQIVAHELGIPAEDIVVEEGDTDTAPFGMGTYASRSTPVAGAAVAMVSRKIRAKARRLAAHLLEVSEEDVDWELGRFYVRSSPDRGVSIQECAMAAYSNMPDGLEPGLEANAYYDPPNLTWPFACYICTVEVDPVTGVWDVLNFVAVDDCGVRINPMIVEGQIMGGLTEAYAMASMQFITFDEDGNCVGSNFMDYLLPTAWETPGYELHEVVTPVPAPPDRRQGHRRVRDGGRPGGVRERRDGRSQGHRGPQHRHAAAARPGLRGPHPAARRLRCAADQDGLVMTERPTRPRTPPRRLGGPGHGRRDGRPRRGVRPGHGGVAAGALLGEARVARHHHRRRTGARLDRRRLRRAGRHPRGAAGDPRPGAGAAPARHARAVRRRPAGAGRAPRDDRHPDLVPERGRRGGLRGTRRPDRAAHRRRPLADGAHPGRPGRRARLGRRGRRRRRLHRRRAGRPVGRRGRDPGSRRRGGARAGDLGPAGVRRPGRLAEARRGRARLPRRPRRCPATGSTGCASPSAWTSATPPTARSPSRSWPSWCSCGPPAHSDRSPPPRANGPGCSRSSRPPRRSTRCAG